MPVLLARFGPVWMLLFVPAGAGLWTLGEYVLHRFAMHDLRGRGILSSEHLEHHVTARWGFDPLIVLAWLGVILVGSGVWGPAGWLLGGPVVGCSLAAGWILGYAYYEYQHAQSHLRGPSGAYTRWLRRHHFHHHFGHPMANHGVTTPVWDLVFGTFESPMSSGFPAAWRPDGLWTPTVRSGRSTWPTTCWWGPRASTSASRSSIGREPWPRWLPRSGDGAGMSPPLDQDVAAAIARRRCQMAGKRQSRPIRIVAASHSAQASGVHAPPTQVPLPSTNV